MVDRLVVIGASHAGCRLAFAARELGFGGEVVLIGAEPSPPYQRPPLSKAYLKGTATRAALMLKSAAAFADAGIELRLATRVAAIDRAAREVVLADGERLAYSRLGLATGAEVRRLDVPGADLAGVIHMRDLADADALAAATKTARRAVVVGGGFIGLEAAASLRSLGLEVVVVEAADRLSPRVFPPVMSDWLRGLHEGHGVEIRLGARVAAILAVDGRVTGVRLADGAELSGDLVVVGIGVVAADDLARAAGLAVDRGVLVDAGARTSDPLIVAAGDCARHPNPWAPDDAPILLESVQNANDQARVAAAALVDRPVVHDAVPWFWSDQYDAKIQMAGLPSAADTIVPRGDPASGRFSLIHLRDGRLASVTSVGWPQDHMMARRLIAERPTIDLARAETHTGPLADLFRPAAPPAEGGPET